METTSAALFISISLVVFGISYYYFTTRHKERMEIIERGLPSDHFKNQTNLLPFLMVFGLISFGIAFGIAVGAKVSICFKLDIYITIAFFIFLGLGIALLSSYLLLRRMHNKRG